MNGGYAYLDVMDMAWPLFCQHLKASAVLEAERLRNQLIIQRASQSDEAGYKRVLAVLQVNNSGR